MEIQIVLDTTFSSRKLSMHFAVASAEVRSRKYKASLFFCAGVGLCDWKIEEGFAVPGWRAVHDARHSCTGIELQQRLRIACVWISGWQDEGIHFPAAVSIAASPRCALKSSSVHHADTTHQLAILSCSILHHRAIYHWWDMSATESCGG